MQPLFSSLLEPRDNASETAFLLIRLFNIKISRSSLKQEIEAHPNYPSLLSITDTLHFYGIENITATFDHDRLMHIPTPFITQIKNVKNGSQFFTVVKELSDTTVTYFDTDNQVWRNTAASGSGSYTCKEKGEVVYDYGDCSTNSSCDANTCSTYSC